MKKLSAFNFIVLMWLCAHLLLAEQNKLPRLPMYSTESTPRAWRQYRILYIFPEVGFREYFVSYFDILKNDLDSMNYKLKETCLGYSSKKDNRVPLLEKGSIEYNENRYDLIKKLFRNNPEYFPSNIKQIWEHDFPDEIPDEIYNPLPQNIKDIVENQMPKRYGGVREAITELEKAKDYDVFAIFTHGWHPEKIKRASEYPKRLQDESGFSVKFSEVDSSDRESQLNDFDKFLFYGTTPSEDTKSTTYFHTVVLQSKYIYKNIKPLFQNNGILIMIACNTAILAKNILQSGTTAYFAPNISISPGAGAAVFENINRRLTGTSSEKNYIDIKNIHQAISEVSKKYNFEELHTKNEISENSTLSLINIAHINDIKISPTNNPDIHYYDFEYRIDENERYYPYQGFDNLKKHDIEQMGKLGYKGAPIPFDKILNVSISFSSEINKDSLKVKLKIPELKDEKGEVYSVEGYNFDCSTVNPNSIFKYSTCHGNMLIEKPINIREYDRTGYNAELYIKAIDSFISKRIEHYKLSDSSIVYLDKDGNGSSFQDGEYDDNHWVKVGGDPPFEILKE